MARDVAGRCESPGSLPPLRCCRLCSPLNAVSLSNHASLHQCLPPGCQVISTARTCNLIIIVLDCLKPITHKKLIEHELEGAWAGWRPTQLDGVDPCLGASRFCKPTDYLQAGQCCGCLPRPSGFGIRLNKKPPEITFRKKDKGGINYTSTVQNPKLDLEGALGDTGLAMGDTGLSGGLLHDRCRCLRLCMAAWFFFVHCSKLAVAASSVASSSSLFPCCTITAHLQLSSRCFQSTASTMRTCT